ncbi:hypothetical protein J31TS4_18530 [Paenibacillus sp. J31TS4]|uniref:hypothetical protein n=1 Tax=Paenibacillus sp. J31TS4 TaxID=2807195 RepID=UPI001B079A2D|nr:hypothetical protein [Paenibacillus sp. J31TS4]GIP38573.1 hypothetical protein J31TS4_18530 [Paenibacillus sp. J31TS4]
MTAAITGIGLFCIGNLLILMAYSLEERHPHAAAYSRFLGMVAAILAAMYLLALLYFSLFGD